MGCHLLDPHTRWIPAQRKCSGQRSSPLYLALLAALLLPWSPPPPSCCPSPPRCQDRAPTLAQLHRGFIFFNFSFSYSLRIPSSQYLLSNSPGLFLFSLVSVLRFSIDKKLSFPSCLYLFIFLLVLFSFFLFCLPSPPHSSKRDRVGLITVPGITGRSEVHQVALTLATDLTSRGVRGNLPQLIQRRPSPHISSPPSLLYPLISPFRSFINFSFTLLPSSFLQTRASSNKGGTAKGLEGLRPEEAQHMTFRNAAA